MAEFHALPSFHDRCNPNKSWQVWNEQAEARAKAVPSAVLPDLGHLSSALTDVYEPSDDSFLLMDAVAHEASGGAWIFPDDATTTLLLEIGSGSGVIAAVAHRCWQQCHGDGQYSTKPKTLHVIATDVNPAALAATRQTLRRNHVPMFDLIQCDLASPMLLQSGADIVIFNPPYVPTPDDEVGGTSISAAWAGGVRGRRVVDRFVPQLARVMATHGVAYLVTVDDNQPVDLARLLLEHGLHMRPLLRRKARNEYLTVQKITHMGTNR